MPYANIKDRRAAARRRYHNNLSKSRARSCELSHRIRARNFSFIAQYKSSHPCEKCGESDPRCLVFHHRDGSEKFKPKDGRDGGMSYAKQTGWSLERIQKEIDKCEMLCANCHSKLHCSWRFSQL